MREVHVDVVMANKLVSVEEAERVTRALERQVKEHFAPVWNISASVSFVGPPEKAAKDAWQLVLLDEEEDGAYGYHQLTKEGMPLGKVMMRTAKQAKTGWSSTASHELLELLANPDTTLGTFVWDESRGDRWYGLEVCDPCQDDPFCYEIGGVAVSDFVHPAWFDTWRKEGSAQFDHQKKLTRPYQIARGGYAAWYDVRERCWVNEAGGKETPTLEPAYGYANREERSLDRGGSRSRLRTIPRPKWKTSAR